MCHVLCTMTKSPLWNVSCGAIFTFNVSSSNNTNNYCNLLYEGGSGLLHRKTAIRNAAKHGPKPFLSVQKVKWRKLNLRRYTTSTTSSELKCLRWIEATWKLKVKKRWWRSRRALMRGKIDQSKQERNDWMEKSWFEMDTEDEIKDL